MPPRPRSSARRGSGAAGARRDWVGNAIIVANAGVTLIETSGTGHDTATASNGGTIDLGTGSVIQSQGFASAAGIIGATATAPGLHAEPARNAYAAVSFASTASETSKLE